MGNPLVAETKDSTKAYSGISLLESANDLKSAIESGDWASVAMGAVGTALDALSMAMDPFGAILAAGVGWLMEHVGPLKEALNGLTGNADEIAAQSETWKNVATELGSIGEDLTGMVKADTVSWTGPAADTYRQRAQDTVTLLETAQKGCEGASSGVKTAGEVVAAVRALVRDIIAELIGHLISWALQVVFTLGIGLTWVVPQVINAVAKTASKIADLVKRLVTALKALVPLLKRAGDLFSDAAKALKNIKPGKAAPPPKHADINGNPKGIDGTHTSGAKDGPEAPPKTDPPPKPDAPPKNDPPVSPPPPKVETPPPGGTPKGAPKSDPKGDGPRDRAQPSDSKTYCGDPVDIATGEVVMTQVDLVLPGDAGDLELSRTHLSAYRAGRWFGRSWASTLDQRLAVGTEAVRFYAEDGMVLVYPVPAGEPVLPLEGPRLPLHRSPGGYRLAAGDRELHFAADGRLTAIERNGSRTEIAYAADGTPAALRRDDGVELRIATDGGRVVALGAPGAAPLVRFGYNRLGQLTTIADFAGRPMTLDYDYDHRLVGWRDRTGTWYRYVYDAQGRCVRAVGANGFYNATFAYSPGTTRHTDALGHTWTYRLNDAGQLVERTDPLGNTRRYTWSRYDQLLSQVDELGRKTRYDYQDGELATVIRPDGSVVRTAPAAEGEVRLRVGDGDAAVQRVVPAADPFTVLPGAAVTAGPGTAPDPLGDAPVTDASVRPGDRDLFGRPQLVHTASGGAARLGWTAEGRRAWRIGPHGDRETWLHDAEGQAVEHRDAAGVVRRRRYGPFGLPVADIDATGARTTYTYDGELRLTSVTNPAGRTWHYAYDPAGRLVAETDYDGRRLTFAYDAAGQLRRMTNGLGEATEFAYDLLGNVIERRTAEDITRYAYDALGRLALAENAEARLELTRDGRGRVIAETVNGLGVAWDYDETAVRRRTSSGVDSEWRFDGDGLPRSLRIAGHDVGFEHDAAGREVTRSVDGEVVLRRRFCVEDRVASEEIAGVGVRTYGYRPDGRLAAVGDTTRPWRIEFDAAGRVSEAHGPGGTERFTRDAAGRLGTGRGETRYTGDAQGRVTVRTRGERSWTYSWDGLDRLRGVRTPDGARWTYHYDPLGRRFAKRRWVTGAGGEAELAGDTRFLWSGFDLVERIELGPDGSRRILTWERHPGDGHPVVQIERTAAGERFRSVITTPAGTPTELLDERGAVTWRDHSAFWGAPLPGADTAAVPLAFPGQHRDAETGLHYNVFRYYDPETARYLSQDPLGLAAAPDPVGYVAEPLLTGDPLGLVGTCGKSGPPSQKRPRPDDFDEHPDLKPPPSKRPDLGVDVNRMTREEWEAFKPNLDDMMKADKHFFWSGGYKKGHGAPDDPYLGSIEFKANSVAKQHGGNTLEGLVADNHLKMPGWVDDKMMKDPDKGYWSHGDHGTSNLDQKNFVKEKWDHASETFAKNSNADTHVVFPDKPGAQTSTGIPNPDGDIYPYRRPDNIFDEIEYKKLEEKGIQVTEHNAETGATKPYQKPPPVKKP